MEPNYALQDITNISRKVGMILKLSKSDFAFEDKEFTPQDVVDMLDKWYSHFGYEFRVTLTVEEAREICMVLYKTGEFCKNQNNDIFGRSLYCSPLLESNLVNYAPTKMFIKGLEQGYAKRLEDENRS